MHHEDNAMRTFTSAFSARPAASACRCSAAMAASASLRVAPISPALRRTWPAAKATKRLRDAHLASVWGRSISIVWLKSVAPAGSSCQIGVAPTDCLSQV